MTPKGQAYAFIKRCLQRELGMRKRFLSGKDGEAKVTECLDALRSLDILYMPEGTEKTVYQQESLFGG